jgi:hypothetical protein
VLRQWPENAATVANAANAAVMPARVRPKQSAIWVLPPATTALIPGTVSPACNALPHRRVERHPLDLLRSKRGSTTVRPWLCPPATTALIPRAASAACNALPVEPLNATAPAATVRARPNVRPHSHDAV